MTLSLYMRFDWSFKHYVIELEAYQVWVGPYILMVSSSIVILLCFFGCWATTHENPYLLGVVSVDRQHIYTFLRHSSSIQFILNM